jgi:peptide chain release factor 3
MPARAEFGFVAGDGEVNEIGAVAGVKLAALVGAEHYAQLREETELLEGAGAEFDRDAYVRGEMTPVFFGSALTNFGVEPFLDRLLELAPAPGTSPALDGVVREVGDDFSAFVFKVQSGMDSAHRDRLAYARVCSGVFERGMIVTHGETGRPFATKYAQAVFGRERSSVETAFPGDVIGLVNANALRVGDTIYAGEPVRYPPIASFAPEHFATVRAVDSGRYKQFRSGIEQLDQEGVVQVLRSDLRGAQSPVLAAVGPMQFEVVLARMESEFKAPVRLERLDYSVARRTDAAGADALRGIRSIEVLAKSDGSHLALFPDQWRAKTVTRDHPDVMLEALPAGTG